MPNLLEQIGTVIHESRPLRFCSTLEFSRLPKEHSLLEELQVEFPDFAWLQSGREVG